MTTWRKLGLVWQPSGRLWWARGYAHLPTPELIEDTIRVYFSALDDQKFGRPDSHDHSA